MEIPPSAPGWQAALVEFVVTRIELIRLEARDATQTASRKARATFIAAIAAALAWAFFLIGIIGLLQHLSLLAWWASALILCAIHLIIAIVAACKLRTPAPPLFPVTRGEFDKDKQWIQSLKSPETKSKH